MDKSNIKGGETMILYSNSDSYGVVSDGKVYSEFIAKKLNVELINRGRGGTCNERIFRTTVRDILELKKTNKEILVLISIATLWRYETWVGKNKFPDDNDGHFFSFQIGAIEDSNNYHDNSVKTFAKEWYLQSNYEALMTNLYYKLILLTNFLKSNNCKYLIWSGPTGIFKEIDYNTPFIKNFDEILQEDKNIIPFLNFNFCDWCLNQKFVPIDYDQFGIYGHHGESAHQAFADFLLKNYLEK
jgi:hypothetical protein